MEMILRPSKREKNIPPGEARLTGIVQYGILGPRVESILKTVAYKLDLDLRIDKLNDGWLIKEIRFVLTGDRFRIIKANHYLKQLTEQFGE